MVSKLRFRSSHVMVAAFALLFAGALLRVHLRVQTTLIGYEIGRIKAEESALLEKRSLLKMQLARLTTRQHLSLMTASAGDSSENSAIAAK